ncbi:MAG: hypothetical protein AMXMBFR58_25980 [Phycisphaerae bacterium]|nr:hypothetical protein [Phycisphaerales bacterium]MCK6475861.1 prepilin-type N-terminal cleavage/methylation domain-containing protein [Phycisphaerales bacterium]
MRRGNPQPGFTLIELMLVLLIISVLLSISMPAMIAARREALAVQCQARLDQIIKGAHFYAHDHREELPSPNWRSTLSDEVSVGWLYRPPVHAWNGETRKSGSLWNYVMASDAYRCGAHRAEQEGSATITSFLMNGAVSAFGERSARPFRLFQFRPMSAMFWDAEDIEVQSESGLGGDKSDGATWPGATPRARHNNAINVALVEGSVIRMPMSRYQAEQLNRPGMLWCIPSSKTGDTNMSPAD